MSYRAVAIAAAIFALLALTNPIRAQAPDAVRLAAAKELMQIAGVAKQFDEVMPYLTSQLAKSFVSVAPDKARRFARCFRQLAVKFVDRKGELIEQIAHLYAEKLAMEDLTALDRILQSPAGMKFVSAQPDIMRQSMMLGQRWGAQLGREIEQEAREELKKRGIRPLRTPRFCRGLALIPSRDPRRRRIGTMPNVGPRACGQIMSMRRALPDDGIASEAHMSAFDYDLFVIGGGSGGVRAARIAAGARRQGGDRRGIPLRRHLRDPRLRAQEAAGLCQPLPRRVRGCRRASAGASATPDFDWPTLIANKDKEIARLEGLYRQDLRARRRRPCCKPAPSWSTPTRVHAAARQPHGHRRASSWSPPAGAGRAGHPGRRHAITSNEAFHLDALPKSHRHRRRRLHRGGVRRHLQWPGRRHHAALSRSKNPARLRRGAARLPHRGAVQARHRRASATPISPPSTRAGRISRPR